MHFISTQLETETLELIRLTGVKSQITTVPSIEEQVFQLQFKNSKKNTPAKMQIKHHIIVL